VKARPWLVVPVVVGVMWTGSAIGTLLTGVTDQQLLDPGSSAPRPTVWTAVPPVPRSTPSAASRTRALPLRKGKTERQRTLKWRAQAECESRGNNRTQTGNGYYGAYQFDLSTWRSVGGHGNPAHATPTEQTHRAQLLYADRGRAPWPYCGRYL
jgi:hypothetical protein